MVPFTVFIVRIEMQLIEVVHPRICVVPLASCLPSIGTVAIASAATVVVTAAATVVVTAAATVVVITATTVIWGSVCVYRGRRWTGVFASLEIGYEIPKCIVSTPSLLV